MSDQELSNSKCYICWEEDGVIDWNSLLSDLNHLTYRDCFFKYTQLESICQVNFSNMICYNCSNGLEYIEAFISKAIETNAKLQKINPELNLERICVEEIEIKEEMNSFEDINICLLENPSSKLNDPEAISKNTNANDVSKGDQLKSTNKIVREEETVDTKSFTLLVRQLRKYYYQVSKKSCRKGKNGKARKSVPKNLNKETKVKPTQKKTCTSNVKNLQIPSATSSKLKSKPKGEKIKTYRTADSKPKDLVETEKTYRTGEQFYLCQYCSAEIKGLTRLEMHELQHTGGRERKETCPQCGVKFYNKAALNLHIKTHDANREKKFKCEFCEKAFFHMGGLNVHRRIHLGQMVKCQICSKEFFRNVELYKHMNSHSSSLINVGVKKRSRYFVKCKYCGKQILSASYRSHTAAHLNQPLVRCSICNKGYFRRESCRHHLKTIHEIKPEKINDYVIILKRERVTHLYIRQNAELEVENK